jgi:hypothetical protein
LSTDSTQRSTWVLPIATGGGVAVPIFEPIIHACGPMSPRKRRFRRRHRRPNASSLASQLTSNPGKYRAGGRPSPNVCEWTAKEGLSIPNIASSPAVVPMPKPDREASRSTKRERPNSSNDIPRTNDSWAREPWRTTPQWNSQWQYEQRWREERRQPNAYWGSWR